MKKEEKKMNKLKSVKCIKALFLALFAALSIFGVAVFSHARTGVTAEAASNYAKAYIVEHTAQWDGTDWSTPTKTNGETVEDGKYALLPKPSISEDGTTLTYFSVEFVLGDHTNRITTLTQHALFDGELLETTDKQKTAATNTVDYHEIWVQNFFGVIPNAFETNDQNSKEAKANALFETLATKYASGTAFETYQQIQGKYTLFYEYVPEGSINRPEEFSFYLLSSNDYDISNIKFDKNTVRTIDKDSATDSKDYNKKYAYQFDKSTSTSLSFPTLSYNPENFVISYTLNQYNFEETTTLTFFFFFSSSTQTGTLDVASSYNNGQPSTTTTYEVITSNNQSVYTKETTKQTENGIQTVLPKTEINKNLVLTCEDGIYNVRLEFTTPGVYEFTKKINLLTNPEQDTAIYRTLEIGTDISTTQNEQFKNPDALWIYGYTATYSSEGVEQKTLFNNDQDLTYLSDFSFLLSNNITNENLSTNLSSYRQSITTFLTNSQNFVMATTNQAPVIFSSNFYLPNYTSAIKGWYLKDTEPTLKEIDKTTRFTDIGKYYVLMRAEKLGDSTTFAYQLFAFEITSSPVRPTIYKTNATDYGQDDVEIMNVNDFTNQNVYLSWTSAGPFEHSISVELYQSDGFVEGFDQNIVYHTYTNLTTIGNKTYTEIFGDKDGFYKFKITSNKNTTAFYSFYIDNDTNFGIGAYNILSSLDEERKINYNLNEQILAQNGIVYTKENFAWTWNKTKPSGATITGVRYFAPITTIDSYQNKLFNDSITTNGQLNAFNSGIKYKRADKNSTLSQSQMLKNAGVYVLVLSDSAGNTSTSVVVFDNTAPTIFVGKTEDGVVKEVFETTLNDNIDIYWTENKAIKVANEFVNSLTTENNQTKLVLPGKEIEIASNIFKKYGDDWYLLVANSKLSIFETSLGGQTPTNNEKDVFESKTKISILVDKSNKTITTTQDDNQLENFDPILLVNQQTGNDCDVMFRFNLTDTIQNTSAKTITFSLDQSGIKFYTFSTDSEITNNVEGNSNFRVVPLTFGTNREIAAIRWQTPENLNIEIESITIDFYPLDLTDTTTYPYSSTKTTFVLYGDDIENTTRLGYSTYSIISGTEFVSNALNTSVVNGINLTLPGRYVVTRTYKESSLAAVRLAEDSITRSYEFFVDRNPAISPDYAAFTVSFGYDAEKYPNYSDEYGKAYTTTEQLTNTSGTNNFGDTDGQFLTATPSFSGNRLDVSLNLPQNFAGLKYASPNLAASTILDRISNVFNVVVMVQTSNDNTGIKYYRHLTQGKTSGYKDISELEYAFKNPGIYRVCIFDLANANSSLTSNPETDKTTLFDSFAPNFNIFYFEITQEKPSGQFVSKSSIDSNYNAISKKLTTNNITRYFTNDDYVVFTFSDSELAFDAKIAYKNIKIKSTTEKFGIQRSVKEFDRLNFDAANQISSISQLQSTTTATLYYSGTTQKTYYVVIPKIEIDPQFNAQPDCTFEITLQYIQSTENEYANKDYFESTSYIYIDHTSPYRNLSNLINNDAYLNEIESLYPNTKQYIINHLDDPNFEFLKHYVFNVTEDFYLTMYGQTDAMEAFYKEYENNTYNGTTATEITSKNYYPEKSRTLTHYQPYTLTDEFNNVITPPRSHLNDTNGNNNPDFRPFEAGKYYDIIECDNAGNYRVYTIYVSGSSSNSSTAPNANISGSEFLTTNIFANMNILNTVFDANGKPSGSKSQKAYWGLNIKNASDIETEKTYNNIYYSQNTFQDISTNASYVLDAEQQTSTVAANDKIYWLIIKYNLTTNLGSTSKTILYFPSADINSGRESSNYIKTLKQMLNLGDNSSVVFVESKQDLLDMLNSMITDAYNTTKATTGAKIEFSFENKIKGLPYYAVYNMYDEENKVVVDQKTSKVVFGSRDLDIANAYNLTINARGLDLVNTYEDFIESSNVNTFTLKIPASNVSTSIKHIYLNDDSSAQNDLIENGALKTSVFSMRQSYKFIFEDNFGVKKTFTYPIDSEYLQQLEFKDGSSLNVYNGSTYTFTCGNTSFVYDSNHLTYKNITITNLETNEVVWPVEKQKTDDDESAENTVSESDFYRTVVNNNGTTTLNFVVKQNGYLMYNIEVGSTSNNPTQHTFILYTIFPTVTITDENGANMIPKSANEQLVTSKNLLVGLVANNKAMFNPKVYLTSDNASWSTEILATADTLIDQNGVYTITLKNDIGSYPAGTITFTRKTYDISIYGVYYNDNNTYTALTKRSQGYKLKFETTTDEQTDVYYKNIDRYFFLASNDSAWENVVVLLNENKQLSLEQNAELNNANYILYDETTRTRIYHVVSSGTYSIDVYFAVTRIPTTTTDLVSDFRINNAKPLTTNLTQIYPTTLQTNENLTATLTWTSSYIFDEEQEIKDFYVLDLWLNGTYIGAYTSGLLVLEQSGNYTIQLRDILGQQKTFSNGSRSYNITIYKDVVFSINDSHPIQNATYNSDVKLSISNINQYQQGFKFEVTRNSTEFDAELDQNGEITFTQPGVYIIKMTGLLRGMGNQVGNLYNEYRFTIISGNEARTNYEFTKRSGYTITKLTKDGQEIKTSTTNENGEQIENSITPLYSLSLDANNDGLFGKGKYEITVSVKGDGFVPTMEYTYTIWINNETAILNSTRDWGTASIAPFTLKLNPYVVYTRIGNCYVTVNGQTVMTINDENKDQNSEISQVFTNPGVYVIQMYSESGNLLSSQRITINEPLNTVAIVLIVLAVVVVVGLVLMFVLIRKRQKVK